MADHPPAAAGDAPHQQQAQQAQQAVAQPMEGVVHQFKTEAADPAAAASAPYPDPFASSSRPPTNAVEYPRDPQSQNDHQAMANVLIDESSRSSTEGGNLPLSQQSQSQLPPQITFPVLSTSRRKAKNGSQTSSALNSEAEDADDTNNSSDTNSSGNGKTPTKGSGGAKGDSVPRASKDKPRINKRSIIQKLQSSLRETNGTKQKLQNMLAFLTYMTEDIETLQGQQILTNPASRKKIETLQDDIRSLFIKAEKTQEAIQQEADRVNSKLSALRSSMKDR